MKKRHSFINPALLLEELICGLTLAVGVWGISRRSLLVFSIALTACSFIVAVVLFICQYHKVTISEDGVTVYYFGTTLHSRPSDIPRVSANYMWGFSFPLSVYYCLSLGLLSGKRRGYTDGEIIRTPKLKLALLSIGVTISDKKDKTLTTPCTATVEITRQEHKLRDKVIRNLGISKEAFTYRARGVFLKTRPHTSYIYGYLKDGVFVSLLEVTKCGKNYKSLDVSEK